MARADLGDLTRVDRQAAHLCDDIDPRESAAVDIDEPVEWNMATAKVQSQRSALKLLLIEDLRLCFRDLAWLAGSRIGSRA